MKLEVMGCETKKDGKYLQIQKVGNNDYIIAEIINQDTTSYPGKKTLDCANIMANSPQLLDALEVAECELQKWFNYSPEDEDLPNILEKIKKVLSDIEKYKVVNKNTLNNFKRRNKGF